MDSNLTQPASNTINGTFIHPPKRICNNEPPANPCIIGTHNGSFHCDEVVACFMLKQLPEYSNAIILRSRDIKLLREKCDILVDIGNEFNHEKKWYDHHQRTFQETFSKLHPEIKSSNFDIKLSSAGLIYTFYGKRVIDCILQKHSNIKLTPENLELAYVQIYRRFIQEIDAIDNGVQMCGEIEPIYKTYTDLSTRISRLNPRWDNDTNKNEDELFEQAMCTAGKELTENVLYICTSWIKARNYVHRALQNAKEIYKSGEIILLEHKCPWKSHLENMEKELGLDGITKLVIFQENENCWRIAGVPVVSGSYLGRKFLPTPWRGLRNEELVAVAGIPKLTFVHHSGFIGGAETKEAALAMAIKSVELSDECK